MEQYSRRRNKAASMIRKVQSGIQPAASPTSPLTDSVVQRALHAPQTLAPTDVMALQSRLGNQMVQRLLDERATAAPPMQARRLPSRVGDNEQVAHQIAGRAAGRPVPSDAFDTTIQRTPGPSIGAEGGDIAPSLQRRISRSQSGGSPLPSSVRSRIEPHLAADLSKVRVHTDANAIQLSRELQARAFTVGNHIFYGKGQSPADIQLTAHEAVHTVQQGAAHQSTIQRWPWSKKNKNRRDGRRSYGADELPPPTSENVAIMRLKTDHGTDTYVGHSWIELQYKRDKVAQHQGNIMQLPLTPFGKNHLAQGNWLAIGFYPQHYSESQEAMVSNLKAGKTPGRGRSFNRKAKGFQTIPWLAKQPGQVEEDDIANATTTTGSVTYQMTQEQIDAVAAYVDSKRFATYSPYGLNCTTFAIGAVKVAGHKPPKARNKSKFGFRDPSGLHKGIKSLYEKESSLEEDQKTAAIYQRGQLTPEMMELMGV